MCDIFFIIVKCTEEGLQIKHGDDGPVVHIIMDIIELSPCEWKKADVFSEWIYVFPTAKTAVAKVLLGKILARYGIPEQIILW